MLTGKQKRYLRGDASLLNPGAYVGKEGLTPEVVKEIQTALKANELVKIRIGRNAPEEVLEIRDELHGMEIGEIIQVIGRNIILFKGKKKDSRYPLP